MNLRRILAALVVVGFVLPIALVATLGLGRLLAALGDAAGAAVLDRIGLAGGLLWSIDLVCLLLVVALDAVSPRDPPA